MFQRCIAIFVVLSFALTGCATMSKNDCVNNDWYQFGLNDGRAGYPDNRMANYVQMCAKHDITIDRTAYLEGHAEGLLRFCDPENGYRLGQKGRTLPAVCPENLQPAFTQAYEKGRVEYQVQRDINAAQRSYSAALREQEGYEEKLKHALAVLYSKDEGEGKQAAQTDVSQWHDRIQTSLAKQVRSVGQLACASGDWYRAGLTDGAAGRGGSTYKQHLLSCEDYHPAPNQFDFISGQSDGLQQYCSFDNGETLGQKGRELSDQCRGVAAERLKQGYKQGLVSYNEALDIASLEIRQSDLEMHLPSLQEETLQLEAELAQDDLRLEQKSELERRLNAVKYQQTRLMMSLEETTNELNCYVADWKTLGFESGMRGEPFKNSSLNCERYDIQVDTQAFKLGYDTGLLHYCTFENGQKLGEKGGDYFGMCPRHLENEFLEGYTPAYTQYQQEKLKHQVSQDLAMYSDELEGLRLEIESLTRRLDSNQLTRREMLDLLNEISDLSKQESTLAYNVDLLSSHWQCLTDDWQGLGVQHGSQGQPSQLRVLDCERFDLFADKSAYHQGLILGLSQWCTESRGYQTAIAGEPISSACSQALHSEYFRGIDKGIQEEKKKQAREQLKSQKLALIEKQPLLKQRIAEIDAALQSPELRPSRKRQLLSEKLQLEKQWLDTEIELESIEEALAQL